MKSPAAVPPPALSVNAAPRAGEAPPNVPLDAVAKKRRESGLPPLVVTRVAPALDLERLATWDEVLP